MTAVGCVAALTAGAVACGTEQELSPGKQLSNAFDAMGKQRSLSVEMGFDASPDQLVALTKGGDEPMPPAMAKALSKLKVTFSAESKKALADSEQGDVTGSLMKVSGAEGDLVEGRFVGDNVYYRVDVKAIAKTTGSPAPSKEELHAKLPQGLEFVDKVLDGQWVKVDTKEMKKVAEKQSEAKGGKKPSAEPTLSEKTQKKILDEIKGVVKNEVTIKDGGKRDGADHVVATAPFRTVLQSVFDKLRPFADEMSPGGAANMPKEKDFKDIPNTKVSVDFAIKKGKLSAASVDLAPLAEKAKVKGEVPLRMTFGDGDAKVAAPENATAVDPEKLIAGLMSMASEARGTVGRGGAHGAGTSSLFTG
ncbi:hypothetical protein [Streptomyces varsoviensis]|uniref:Lipoprotein n=1 Tax=Streptomyces varsoviensis TaxID=67373 RepID=A0ABR5JCK7_9ACTN|nr:hypothetical protein [Streptomyces varsoviensis]KOG91172.1 hypothetical protein ADK38_04635 [Streptomyces varsoviensis]